MRIAQLFFILIFTLSFSFGQGTNKNLHSGIGANGYDLTAYFAGSAKGGKPEFTASFDGVKYMFASQANLKAFNENPEKYLPQYGGWCAYAMAKKGEKVSIDPKTFEIRNGKLYLFYNKLFNNTFDSWKKEVPDELVRQADKNWEELTAK